MGRARKSGADRHRKPGEPAGATWEGIKARLWVRWLNSRRPCYHCGCPDPDQVEHLISYQRRPDLAMDEDNLAPTHGTCPHCGLSCNTLAASNSAERDYLGRSVPFSPGFKAAKVAELARKGRWPGPRGGNSRNPGKTAPSHDAAIGREW